MELQGKLSEHQVISAEPREKLYRLSDGGGLVLHIPPTGSKAWRFRYKFGGKEKMISAGTFPVVSLKEARMLRLEYRKLVKNGFDPSLLRKEQRVLVENNEVHNLPFVLARSDGEIVISNGFASICLIRDQAQFVSQQLIALLGGEK